MDSMNTVISTWDEMDIRPTHSLELYKFCEILMNAADRFQQSGDAQWDFEQITPHHLLARHRLDELILGFVGNKPVAAMILSENVSKNLPEFREDEKALYIEKLSVHSDYASTGVSQKMVDYAKARGLSTGVCLLHLVCNGKGKRLSDALNRLGFEAVERIRNSESSHRYFRISL